MYADTIRMLPPRTPPRASQCFYYHFFHGKWRIDPYAWLSDPGDPEVRAYLEAENAYTEDSFAALTSLRKKLLMEFREHIGESGEAEPLQKDDWIYYSRWETELAYPIHYRRQENGNEQVVVDENQLQGEGNYLSLDGLSVAPDHNSVAFAVDRIGNERCDLYIHSLPDHKLLAGPIRDVGPALAWGNGHLYFTRLDHANRPAELCRLQSDGHIEALLFESEPSCRLVLTRSESGAFIVVNSMGPDSSEVWLLDTADPNAIPNQVLPRRTGIEYSVTHQGQWLYLVTNENAVNFKVLRTAVSHPWRWLEFIPHRSDTLIHYLQAFSNKLVIHGRRRGQQSIWVWDEEKENLHEIQMPESVYALEGGLEQDYFDKCLRFYYSSPLTPDHIVDYHMEKNCLCMNAPSIDGYQVSLLHAKAADGTDIPITLIYREDLRNIGGNPVLLYGYGAYGLSIDPAYSASRFSLLDRGIIYAIAHVRGGGELGRNWHRAGRAKNKNVGIDDFINCAEFLISSGWADPQRIAAMGESAGATLVAAALNRRPDIFRVTLLNVPFLDPLTILDDPDQPLTAAEWSEWGDPADIEDYQSICTWAPYDNIVIQSYPDILITASLNDPRTPYWEAAKWVANMRESATDGEVLLHIAMEGGHSGASGQFSEMEQQIQRYAFLIDRLGCIDVNTNHIDGPQTR